MRVVSALLQCQMTSFASQQEGMPRKSKWCSFLPITPLLFVVHDVSLRFRIVFEHLTRRSERS